MTRYNKPSLSANGLDLTYGLHTRERECRSTAVYKKEIQKLRDGDAGGTAVGSGGWFSSVTETHTDFKARLSSELELPLKDLAKPRVNNNTSREISVRGAFATDWATKNRTTTNGTVHKDGKTLKQNSALPHEPRPRLNGVSLCLGTSLFLVFFLRDLQ